MDWIKRNLGFVSGAGVAAGLLMWAIAYGWSGWRNHAAEREGLRQGRAELERLELAEQKVASGRGLRVELLTLRCRGVDLSETVPGANEQMACELAAQLKRSPLLGEVALEEQVQAGAETFTIGVRVKLKEPLKLAAGN